MKENDMRFLQLWDLYSPLLTETQQEITDLYFNCDLSLGEIAEQKGVSRQSVSDCLNKCRKQLEKYEEKLNFAQILDGADIEHVLSMSIVGKWVDEMREKYPALKCDLDRLEEQLTELQQVADGAAFDEE